MHREDAGLATLETTLMITILVPLLFAVIEFGDIFQRWLAQESVTIQVARYAAELGGDGPEVRALFADSLRRSGIDPAFVILRRSKRGSIIKIRAPIPVAIPAFELLAQILGAQLNADRGS